MNHKTIAIGGVTAGLLFAAWGVLARENAPAVSGTVPAIESLVSAQPTNGLRSTEQVVKFWTDRVAASPAGYLDRTQLGLALAAEARENADLEGYEAAERVLREALEINPQHGSAKLALAQSLHSQHRFAEARNLAAEVLGAEPGSLGALALQGDASLELGEYTVARRLYTQLADRERSAPVVSRLSRLTYFEGKSAESVALAEEALALSDQLELRPTDRAFYRFQLGHVRFVTGDVDGAVQSLEDALDVAPDHPGAREKLAVVYASAGRVSEAEELYRALLESGPAADLHGSYADLLRARGEIEAAEEHERLGLELATETMDRFPAERRHLAGFFMTRDAPTAVRLAEQDLAERRDVGAYDTLAWALYHDGRFADADAAIEQALASGVSDPSILYHAGSIAAANGDEAGARGHIGEALAISTMFHPSEAADAMSLLESLG